VPLLLAKTAYETITRNGCARTGRAGLLLTENCGANRYGPEGATATEERIGSDSVKPNKIELELQRRLAEIEEKAAARRQCGLRELPSSSAEEH
jgi:hypothetical protein